MCVLCACVSMCVCFVLHVKEDIGMKKYTHTIHTPHTNAHNTPSLPPHTYTPVLQLLLALQGCHHDHPDPKGWERGEKKGDNTHLDDSGMQLLHLVLWVLALLQSPLVPWVQGVPVLQHFQAVLHHPSLPGGGNWKGGWLGRGR